MGLYLDTSVLIRLYVVEPQSKFAREMVRDNYQKIIISELSRVEFYAALAIKTRTKQSTESEVKRAADLFETHLERSYYLQTLLNTNTYKIAAEFLMNRALTLKTLDSLHLAVVQQIEAELVTADKQFFKASQVCGVKARLIK